MKPKILFLCTGNSCRSQMAEVLTRHYWSDILESYSAGTKPAGLNDMALEVLEEEQLSTQGVSSKHLDSFGDTSFEYVVTVCDSAKETCPYFTGTILTLHRSFEDPPALAEQVEGEQAKRDCYRKVRDEIRVFVQDLRTHLDLLGENARP